MLEHRYLTTVARPHRLPRGTRQESFVASEREHTVRIGYGQVLERPCLTARKMGLLLRRRGWDGEFSTCPSCAPD